MRLPRRLFLASAPLLAAGPATRPALAQGTAPAPAAPAVAADDPRFAERGIGPAEAPLKVIEFFSLTCSHCAAFHKETLPQVKANLVAAGQIRLVWRDFPLDRLALAAAAVARTLPAARYESFIGALLGNQDRWAFTSGDPREELGKMAALAGMTRATFEQIVADEGYQRAILELRGTAEREFSVNSTPFFVFGTRPQPGNMPYEDFARRVQEAKRG